MPPGKSFLQSLNEGREGERRERTTERTIVHEERERERLRETKGPLKLDLASDSDKWEGAGDENADDNELIL